MKKFFFYLSIACVAVILVTVGIDASDHYDNFSESIVGRLWFGEDSGPCPAEMVFVANEKGGFCIDRYEASAGDDCPYREPVNQGDSRVNLDHNKCKPVSVVNALPWRYISQSQAAVACAKSGKRLATATEWYQASLGTPDMSKSWQADDCQVDRNWSMQPGRTGDGVNCVSAFGAYDMIGNVWEWVSGEIAEGRYNSRELPADGYVVSVDSSGLPVETSPEAADENYNEDYLWIKKSDVRGIARGGYWDNQEKAGFYSLYLVSSPSFAGTGVGFRCVK